MLFGYDPAEICANQNSIKTEGKKKGYILSFTVLLLLFAVAFGVVRAQENSEKMRTGREPRTVDYRDISAFFGERFAGLK